MYSLDRFVLSQYYNQPWTREGAKKKKIHARFRQGKEKGIIGEDNFYYLFSWFLCKIDLSVYFKILDKLSDISVTGLTVWTQV
jgi:hypothetical protein